MKHLSQLSTAALLFVMFAGALFGGSQDSSRSKRVEAATEYDSLIDRGRSLANAYCSGCHLFPEPSQLTQTNWTSGALRHMAPFLGVTRINLDKRPDGNDLKEAGFFPTEPLISKGEWEAIHLFYASSGLTNAPLPKHLQTISGLFIPKRLLRSNDVPCTSLLHIEADQNQFFIGDAQTRTLKLVSHHGNVIREWETDSAPVSLSRRGSDLAVTLIGRVLPSDERVGQVLMLNETESSPATKIIRGLRRPAHSSWVDLDSDGRDEIVISCFGNRLGELAYFSKDNSGEFRKHLITEGPGAVRCLPYDWNGDGMVDLTLLKAQGREGAELFINKGNGEFSNQRLWDDPPTYGNTYFELVDFDADRRPELVVINGDNGDFNSAPKSYHGIRIFKVSHDLKVELRFRFSMFGAYGARAADFDMDGDLDIAVVSYFPDYEHAPEQSFVYLRNEGDWRFTPGVIGDLSDGRWITLDAGDLDNDGDTDLLLGSFARGPRSITIPENLTKQWETEKVAVLMLENQTRSPKRE